MSRACSADSCPKKHHAKGYCSKHYSQLTRTGNAETPPRRQEWNLDPIRKHLFHNAKGRAKARGLVFALRAEDIVVPEFCPVLGIRLAVGAGVFVDSSPSLDRIRPELGYVPGNVRVISWRANRIKNDASLNELLLIARYIQNE